jgi:hypothetical protein
MMQKTVIYATLVMLLCAGCHSDYSQGTEGIPGADGKTLGVPTVSTLKGAQDYWTDGASVVYFVGDASLEDNYTVASGKTLVIISVEALENRAVVTSDMAGKITVPMGRTLTVNGNLRANTGGTLAVDGTFRVNGVYRALSGAAFTKGGTAALYKSASGSVTIDAGVTGGVKAEDFHAPP